MFRVGFFGVFGGDLEGLTRGLTLWVLRWWVRLRLCCVLRGLRLGRGLTVVSFVNLCHGLVSVGQAVAASLWGERHGVALLFWGKGSRSWGEWGCVVGDSCGVGGRSGCWRALGDARGLSPPT